MSLLVRGVSTAASYGQLIVDENDQVYLLHQIREAVLHKNYTELNNLLSNADFDVINSRNLVADDAVLDYAASLGDYELVELLLDHGAIPDYNRPNHSWPSSTLSRAIIGRNPKVIQLLIKNGCDPDTILRNAIYYQLSLYRSPSNYWHLVILQNDLHILRCLLEGTGRKIGNDEWSQKIMLKACALGAYVIVEYLLDEGVSTESTSEDGWTYLFYAVAYRHIRVIEQLIDRGANCKHKDLKGRTPLHIAIFYNIAESSSDIFLGRTVSLLLGKGADINADINGLTLINAALRMKNNNIGIINQLLDNPNIDLSKPDKRGVTFLHRVIDTGYQPPFRTFNGWGNVYNPNAYKFFRSILSRVDVDINARDKDGITPLQLINDKSLNCLSELLEFGSDTRVLHNLKNDMFKNQDFLKLLGHYGLKRSAADLSDDPNIDTLLAQYCVFSEVECHKYVRMYFKEVQNMKNTILCDDITFYDFLHAKKRKCIEVAKRPEMREIFMERRQFVHYANMLAKQYLSGLRPLTPIETEAMNSAEENLDYIFQYQLPSLVTYNIKKYLDIEDAVTLNNIKI